jgi:membrane protease YdiL (CAAX protease family)
MTEQSPQPHQDEPPLDQEAEHIFESDADEGEDVSAELEAMGFRPFVSRAQPIWAIAPEEAPPASPAAEPEPPLFQSYLRPDYISPTRIPHLGHLAMLAVMALLGLLCASLLTRSALYFHLFGVSTVKQAMDDFRYTLGSQTAFYLLTFVASLVFFPLIWGKGLFAGMQWNASSAAAHRWRLMGAAAACFVLAMIDGMLMPGPNDTPIDKVLRTPDAPWMLFAFGITLAPFFEEIAFRGFLLPSLCTAWDWLGEQTSGQAARPLGPNGHPQWSIPAMIAASILTSVPFALMHAEQTGYSLGPFLLLLCVSMVLCWARLSTRSLAASVLVHACYNFMLFFFMLLGTGGFRHLDKM